MADHESGEVAEEDSDELHFEDRLLIWLTAPMWWLIKLPFWIPFLIAVWNAVGLHSIWHDWVYAQPSWLIVTLVFPVFYLTIFGAVPMILYTCIFAVMLPWRAPALPAQPVRSIIRQRVGRLRTAMTRRQERRVKAGAWIMTGNHLVQFGSDRLRATRRPVTWIDAARNPERTGWTSRALPKLDRKSADRDAG